MQGVVKKSVVFLEKNFKKSYLENELRLINTVGGVFSSFKPEFFHIKFEAPYTRSILRNDPIIFIILLFVLRK